MREVLERRAELHPGVVDQDVDRAELGLDAGDAGGDGGGVGDVEGRGRGAGDGGGGRSQAVGVAAVEHDRRAVDGEALGEREADALARAGDEGAAAGEVEERAHDWTAAASISSARRIQRLGGCAPETA